MKLVHGDLGNGWPTNCLLDGMSDTPELELIAQCQQGDQAAIDELFGRHYPSSLRLARGILRSEDESQDAVQVAYFAAFRHLDRFRGDACFKTWITRIVVNCCLMQLRQPWRRVTWVGLDNMDGGWTAEALSSAIPTPEKTAWSNEMTEAVSDAVMKLPKHLRDVITLYSLSDLSLKEVASALCLTIPATKTRLFRARARLRMRLQPVWSEARPSGVAARPRAGAARLCA
jgi:RNA polymerase sigma-70 factor (ECF subfamily)